jgi:tRNA threonylcarbamoyladenosine biosynthesis protein TsaB
MIALLRGEIAVSETRVLAFDCAGRGCAVAVRAGSRLLARRREAMERGQAGRLVPMIASVLDEAGMKASALDLIAVTTGPGGFTGIRIGLATARGLALATGKPAIGISNFDAIAAAVPPSARRGRSLIVALDSKRAEFFLQAFGESGTVLGAGRQVAPAQLQSFLPPGALILAGDAAALLAPLLAGRDVVRAQDAELPDPALIARLALSRFGAEPLPPPLPLYLRPPDTTLPQAP